MTILVIGGATGLVAGALAKHPGVIAIGRPNADLANPETLAPALDEHAPLAVICAGAFTAVDRAEAVPDEAMRINGDGPGALARLCAARGVPLIHISTDYVFDGAKSEPYLETDAPGPLNAYGRSKLAGERAVAAAGGRYVIVRTSWLFAAQGSNFVRTMLRLAETRDQIDVVDDQRGSPTYAPHLAVTLLAIARTMIDTRAPVENSVVHATAEGDCSWRGFAEAIFDSARSRGGPCAAVRPVDSEHYATAALRPRNSRLDTSKLRESFAITLPHWRAGLDACLDEIATKGWRLG